jgi:LmbE family N-acetylglucosaminyl deacetylase
MTTNLKLLFVLAHPDDETLGNGGTIARYADEGIETHLVTATGGEKGWFGDPDQYPGPQELARIRESELNNAAKILGLASVSLLGYEDGDLANASTPEVVGKIVSHIRRVRPQVVVTFDQNGLYGHPDHIAITQYTTAAVAAAANPGYTDPEGRGPHQVQKLYYMAWTENEVKAYEEPFGEFLMHIDGSERRSIPWPEWSITTRIEAPGQWKRVWDAIECHRSQLPEYKKLLALPEEKHRNLWGVNVYYRAFSTVDCGDGKVESDLFAGIR